MPSPFQSCLATIAMEKCTSSSVVPLAFSSSYLYRTLKFSLTVFAKLPSRIEGRASWLWLEGGKCRLRMAFVFQQFPIIRQRQMGMHKHMNQLRTVLSWNQQSISQKFVIPNAQQWPILFRVGDNTPKHNVVYLRTCINASLWMTIQYWWPKSARVKSDY
jgi:hypothetical protein